MTTTEAEPELMPQSVAREASPPPLLQLGWRRKCGTGPGAAQQQRLLPPVQARLAATWQCLQPGRCAYGS